MLKMLSMKSRLQAEHGIIPYLCTTSGMTQMACKQNTSGKRNTKNISVEPSLTNRDRLRVCIPGAKWLAS